MLQVRTRAAKAAVRSFSAFLLGGSGSEATPSVEFGEQSTGQACAQPAFHNRVSRPGTALAAAGALAVLAGTIPVLGLPTTLLAQVNPGAPGVTCDGQWLAEDGFGGFDSAVQATTMWDPDGPGPAPKVLVISGTFAASGTVNGQGLVSYDPATGQWASFGFGQAYGFTCLASGPNGELYVGGTFTNVLGVTASRVAVYKNGRWSGLGKGLGGAPVALHVLPNGDLIAGGEFTTAGDVTVASIARWDGQRWSALGAGSPGSGGTSGTVRAITSDSSGRIIAAGSFPLFTGSSLRTAVARFENGAWVPLTWSPRPGVLNGIPPSSNPVTQLGVAPNGDIVAAGNFTFSVPGETVTQNILYNSVARWNGSRWLPIGTGIAPPSASTVLALALDSSGQILVGGSFGTTNTPPNSVYRWNGTSWVATGNTQINRVISLTKLDGGQIIAAGGISINSRNSQLAQYDGTTWRSLARGFDGVPLSLTRLSDDRTLALGNFFNAGSTAARYGALRSVGGEWSPMPLNGLFTTGLRAGAALPGGGYVVTGSITGAGGVSTAGIAKYQNGAWSALGSGMNVEVIVPVALRNGDILAVGGFDHAGGVPAAGVARWNGSTWLPLGSGLNANGSAAIELANGDIIVVGSFTTAGGVPATGIARWDGSQWSPVGGGVDGGAFCIAQAANGDLIVGGNFTSAGGVPANRIARFNGTTWSALGGGLSDRVDLIQPLPDGGLLVSGSFAFADGRLANRIARWTGTRWLPIGGGVSYFPASAISLTPQNDVLLAGPGTLLGDRLMYGVTRWRPSVPACSVADVATPFGCPDGNVDGSDFISFINSFALANVTIDSAADVNDDGVIDGADFVEFINAYAQGC